MLEIECCLLSIPAGIGALTGAAVGLVCYALSVPLSPLIIGSIATVVSAAFISIPLVLFMSIFADPDTDPGLFKSFSTLFIPQVAIGIGLSAAINAISGTMLSINSAINLGALIGFVTPALTLLAAIYLPSIAEKVNECIVKPIVEKVKEYFSSQENNSSYSSHITQSNNNKGTLQVDSVEQLEDNNYRNLAT